MRLKLEILAGFTALVLLLVLAGVEGARRNRQPSRDFRRSTYLDGPFGASAYAAALGRLGVRVDQFRGRLSQLDGVAVGDSIPLFAVLSPSQALDLHEAALLARFAAERGDLLLAGAGAGEAMRCFGYRVERRERDSVAAHPPGDRAGSSAPMVWAVLARSGEEAVSDTTSREDLNPSTCRVPTPVTAETLLVTAGGRVVALRLQMAPATHVTLVADGGLFANRALRDTDAGPFALALVVGHNRRVVFDEYHHGFQASGNLGARLMEWGGKSPWGWAMGQLGFAGLVALLAGAVRFGPPHRIIERRRRSPLEHVRALASALAAARGHDVAVDLLIQGLRRRLGRGIRTVDPGPERRAETLRWLRRLEESARTPHAREAVQALQEITARPQPAAGVLRTASAVEDVWDQLRP